MVGGPWAINEEGTIVGCSQTTKGARQAFVWTSEEGMQPLDSPGGDSCRALAITLAGTIAGNAKTQSGEEHACVWVPSSTGAQIIQPEPETVLP